MHSDGMQGHNSDPSHWRRCIELTLKCLLDCATQFNPRLIDRSKAIPHFEGPDVHAGHEKEADCIVNNLAIGVWIVSNDYNLGAIFDVAE